MSKPEASPRLLKTYDIPLFSQLFKDSLNSPEYNNFLCPLNNLAAHLCLFNNLDFLNLKFLTFFMKLFFKILTAVVLVSFLAWYFSLDLTLWVLSQHPVDVNQYSKQIEQDFEKYYPQMLIDANTMEGIAVFNSLTYTKDASEFLNPLVSWSYDGSLNDKTSSNKETLKLDPELIKILNTDKDYSQIKIDWSQKKLDFSWFNKLHNFDHWNYTQNTPYSKSENNFEVMTSPTPDFSELLRWSKLYLLYSRDLKQLEANSEHIDHLAKLIYSHPSFLNAMVAVSILRIKKEFHASLNEAQQKQVKGVLLTKESIKVLRRFLSTISGLYSVLTPTEIFDKARLINISACLLLEETIAMNVDFKYLFSLSYPDVLLRIDQMRQQSLSWCPESYAKRVWGSQSYIDRQAKMNPFEMDSITFPERKKSILDLNFTHEVSFSDLARSPKKAKAITDIILSVGNSDPFRLYKENN